MPEPGKAVFQVVAGDPIDRGDDGGFERAYEPVEPGVYSKREGGAAEPAVSAEVQSVGMELFPAPDAATDAIQWVDTPPAALVELPEDQDFAGALMLADSSGRLFEVARVEQLAAIPAGRLLVLHRPPAGATVFDVILISEGYAAADVEKFLATARGLSAAFLGIEPYRSCRNRLRISALFLASPESGISERKCDGSQHRDGICPATTRNRRTLFGMTNMVSNYCRLIAGNEIRVRDALKADHIRPLLAHSGINPGMAVVVGNTTVYGGAGAADVTKRPSVVWTAPTPEGGAVMAHEMGHALGLQDEYEDSGTGLPHPKHWVNISSEENPSKTPWRCRATDHGTTFPSCRHHSPTCACEPSLIGTFEGAGHVANGRFRPTKNCAMRTTGASFCPICAAHITNRLSGNLAPLCP
jgi:hypothetical protein